MRHNCPVCFEYLFDSVRPTAVLPCGHTIHSDCLKEMERHRQLACPTCLRSYADLAPVWRRVDEEVAATPMPPEYAAWVVSLLCNDCGGRGAVRFHVLGHKCGACGAAFGAYACLRCCFFEDDTRKRQFHCDQCGICRVGGQENFFHCATCGCCYSKSLEVRK